MKVELAILRIGGLFNLAAASVFLHPSVHSVRPELGQTFIMSVMQKLTRFQNWSKARMI